ncbi:hypothetical protein GCM10007913_41930 [Devosia yakushimensis]|uniref:DUF2214 family protein n=1 Tax=Devosia yakushimensis TaxID=470028 RepID=A0ABQ5UK98_9HYPH|nr:DUF2214 family protein [Devosia yakushimensis]GLQ12260.1 hypothetical protein GCM10007913_41930 [Devosia yakushimensis]
MDIGLLLAIAHHLAVFTLVGIIAAEFAMLRPGIAGSRLNQLAKIDGAYGAVAGLVIVVGFLRVFFGGTDASYYLTNFAFWGKMAAFLVVGLLSIQPTLSLLRWRKRLASEPDFAPPASEIAASRRFVHGEVAVLVLIPIFAAAMARGYGIA